MSLFHLSQGTLIPGNGETLISYPNDIIECCSVALIRSIFDISKTRISISLSCGSHSVCTCCSLLDCVVPYRETVASGDKPLSMGKKEREAHR